MIDDTACSEATCKGWLRRGFGLSVVLVAVVTVGVIAAACGSGSNDPGAASAARNTTTSTTTTAPSSGSPDSASSGQTAQSEELQLAQCMRSHGVPSFPDPPASGGLLNAISAAGINTQSPTYQSALQSCKKYTPAGTTSPAQSATENAQALEFSQCMRSHGVPNFPDPSTGPTGGTAINLQGTGIDPSSPTYQAANQACGGK